MKLPETLFARCALAYLPFWVYGWDLGRGCLLALWVVFVSWTSLVFFWFTRRFFPGTLLKEAFFFWLAIWAQGVWSLTGVGPLWVLSVFFLTPLSFLEKGKKAGAVGIFSKKALGYAWERTLAGISFAVFVVFLTWAQEGMKVGGWAVPFQQPAAMFLLVGFIAVFWKDQASRK